MFKVDMRTISLAVPSEEKLTKDSVTICMDDVSHLAQNVTMAKTTNVIQNPYFRTKKCSRDHSDREEIAHSMPCALDGALMPQGETWSVRNANSSVHLLKARVSEAECPTESKAKPLQLRRKWLHQGL